MKRIIYLSGLLCLLTSWMYAQNPLNIPPTISGNTINLDVQTGSQSFYPGTTTPTYGINGAFMSPTIVVNKGDSITLNVTNNLPERTTMHWHGLHVAAMNDGGPHQNINPGATWSPSFKIRNNAGTFWYHPHGAGITEMQVSKGLAGLFIIHDSAEQALAIPHTYGTDDIPIIVQTKAFDILHQIAMASEMDTAIFVNGTVYPYFNAPAQVVRFRMLNGSSLRSFNFGLSNGQTFYQTGTDGGLLDTPKSLTRLLLSPGERAEILIDFSGMQGDSLYLESFASEMPNGIYGAAMVGSGIDTIMGYSENPLNGTDYNILKFNITAATANPVQTIPPSLVPLTPYDPSMATFNRPMVFDTIRLLPADRPNRAEGPFGINKHTFSMDSINEVVYLNTTETWTIVNHTLIAHPFHIHDVQFNVIEEGGVAIPPKERGWKDVVLVMPGDSVKILTKFETFADPHMPYMYHCHLLHHEDDGMMGTFVVVDSASLGVNEQQPSGNILARIYPNPAKDVLHINIPSGRKGITTQLRVSDLLGREIYSNTVNANNTTIATGQWDNGIYLLTLSDGKSVTNYKVVIQK